MADRIVSAPAAHWTKLKDLCVDVEDYQGYVDMMEDAEETPLSATDWTHGLMIVEIKNWYRALKRKQIRRNQSLPDTLDVS